MFEYVVVEPFDDLAGRRMQHGDIVPALAAEMYRGHVVRRLATPAENPPEALAIEAPQEAEHPTSEIEEH